MYSRTKAARAQLSRLLWLAIIIMGGHRVLTFGRVVAAVQASIAWQGSRPTTTRQPSGELGSFSAGGCVHPVGLAHPRSATSGWQTDERPDHAGNDLPADEGTPVLAAWYGKVIFNLPYSTAEGIGSHRERAGHFIEVEHCFVGLNQALTQPWDHCPGRVKVSRYLHLKEGGFAEPQAQTWVTAGQQIAEVGRTGVHHSGAHLHFEVRDGDHYGPSLDPPTECPAIQ